MIAFLKYLKGYVRIKVWGFSPERFMNLCSNKNILLWDIIREEDIYYMSISLSGFYQLRPIVRKTGTKVVILKRYGLPFFVPVLWARKIFVLGLVLCVAFWLWSSLFVWDIDLSGNFQITQDVFFSFLETNNITVGIKKADVDLVELEKQIRQTFPEITWTSTRLNGTKLEIDIKENDAPIIAAVKEKEGAKDLIADVNGTVVSMIVRSGVPKVAIGDTVESGTIMVEGKVPVYNEDATVREYQYVVSDADIYVEHTILYEDILPFDYIAKEYTGRTKKRYFIRFGDREAKMAIEQPFLNYDCVIKESKPDVFEKLNIPVFWGSYTYREYQKVEYEYSLKQAKEELEGKIRKFYISLEEKGVQITEKDVKIDTDSNSWVVSGEFRVIEKIGNNVDTAVEEILDIGVDEVNE